MCFFKIELLSLAVRPLENTSVVIILLLQPVVL